MVERSDLKRILMLAITLGSVSVLGQGPGESSASMKQLMLDLIYPSSNSILLTINRGGPKDESEWAEVRRSALTLRECGSLLTLPARARDQGAWLNNTKLLSAAGAAAYQAAQAMDSKALATAAEQLDAACTTCHKQYRPNVFQREGGSK
jgi:hypothetical protein